MCLLDVERVEYRNHVPPEALDGIGRVPDLRLAMTAAIVTDHPEPLAEGGHLRLPHRHGGAERVGKHQRGTVRIPFHGDIQATISDINHGHVVPPSNRTPSPGQGAAVNCDG